jgi:hypothetical protein
METFPPDPPISLNGSRHRNSELPLSSVVEVLRPRGLSSRIINHGLSQLCSKYWGEIFEEEAKEWCKLQPTVEVDRTNDMA